MASIHGHVLAVVQTKQRCPQQNGTKEEQSPVTPSYRIGLKGNMEGATCGTRHAHPSGEAEFVIAASIESPIGM